MAKIKVLVADDHPTFREGLCRFLEEQPDIEVVAQANDGGEAIRLAGEAVPDVAIIDIAMPGVDGIEAARQIQGVSGDRQVPDCNVVMAHGNGGVLSSQCSVILGSAATV